MKVLVTGAAGFIGFHLANRLLALGHEVVGIDNINDYYSTELKFARLKEAGISNEAVFFHKKMASSKFSGYSFFRINLEDIKEINNLFSFEKFDIVCHLAAQAGVRYSLENPHAYISSNITGFLNILEACRKYPVKHLVYASSSSVYGNNAKMPLSTDDSVDNPISLYAATKKSNELMAHTYNHLYGIPTTGLRFFTVYGPWGRPDMAYFLFTKAILEGKPIKVFNHGDLYRDFTYIDDIVEGVVRVALGEQEKTEDGSPKSEDESLNQQQATSNEQPATSNHIYNIGNSSPVKLLDFIETIEKAMGKKAIKEFCEMQPGDVYKTYADITPMKNDFGWAPETSIEKGIGEFVRWYRVFYR